MSRMAMVVAGAAAALLTACGSGIANTDSMRPDAATQLQSDVLVLTKQAAARNWQGARTALSTLRADLAASVSAGAVSSERAAQIEATIAQVAARIPAAATPTPTPTTRTTTATSTTPSKAAPPKKPAPPPPPDKHHHHGHG